MALRIMIGNPLMEPDAGELAGRAKSRWASTISE
ncbi:hypothetical protein A2U01_0009668, partial [Trifolium medium]|nr:hypothetical protein [Trifolium medium]